MHSRIGVVVCTIAIFLVLASSSVAVAEEQHLPRAKKLPNAAWLGAPHFQALLKRGRFVFRETPYFHDSTNENIDLQPDKRNWRL
jgi:hypothetical protein